MSSSALISSLFLRALVIAPHDCTVRICALSRLYPPPPPNLLNVDCSVLRVQNLHNKTAEHWPNNTIAIVRFRKIAWRRWQLTLNSDFARSWPCMSPGRNSSMLHLSISGVSHAKFGQEAPGRAITFIQLTLWLPVLVVPCLGLLVCFIFTHFSWIKGREMERNGENGTKGLFPAAEILIQYIKKISNHWSNICPPCTLHTTPLTSVLLHTCTHFEETHQHTKLLYLKKTLLM